MSCSQNSWNKILSKVKLSLPMRRNFDECIDRLVDVLYFYRPQRSCEGYVFTGVCLSRGVCLSACWDTTPPGADPPPEQTSSWEQTPPLDQTPPPPRTRHPPGPGPPPRRLLLRTVCILLECILVFNFESLYFASKWSNGNQNVDTIVEFYL